MDEGAHEKTGSEKKRARSSEATGIAEHTDVPENDLMEGKGRESTSIQDGEKNRGAGRTRPSLRRKGIKLRGQATIGEREQERSNIRKSLRKGKKLSTRII